MAARGWEGSLRTFLPSDTEPRRGIPEDRGAFISHLMSVSWGRRVEGRLLFNEEDLLHPKRKQSISDGTSGRECS